ncbi:uncharacterized protein RCC_07744 [Ramularia collo-cygni]|uniref:AA1-like domain-containing protein n=1 Tax=Ramularia collo-cygni TaxID=112498 RepID=A0A2D3V246_9PEZI|nr:uncharacterized protein RCC_07744 [Ramularia collo-cygni]CZT21878.1 uncharacterized protein RCC_07744 [Ramularia collo-cygni]
MAYLLYLLAACLGFLSMISAQPTTIIPPGAIINIEAIWDSAETAYSNKTFIVPLDEVWQHEAFNQCNALYLIGAKGNVNKDTIQCQLYWRKPNDMGYAGLYLTSKTPASPHDVAADLSDASLQLRCQGPR